MRSVLSEVAIVLGIAAVLLAAGLTLAKCAERYDRTHATEGSMN